MARKLRVEYPGAIYHVINRGNYRSWIFETEGAQEAFEACLAQACERSGWILHAYVLMGNHYHLAIETPQGNLVTGMHWLEATFANRFNRFRGERGHLFQARYKALLVEPGTEGLGRLCDYIALNPCRAGICDVDGLVHYRRSSYWYLRQPERRPGFLRPQTALLYAGGMPDSEEGWSAYARHLKARLQAWRQLEDAEVASLSRGSAIGSEGFCADLAKEHEAVSQVRTVGKLNAKEAQQLRWQAQLQVFLGKFTAGEREDDGQSALWKVAVASAMKATTAASNGWLAQQLRMGSGKYVSRLVCDPAWQRRLPEEWKSRLSAKTEDCFSHEGTKARGDCCSGRVDTGLGGVRAETRRRGGEADVF